MSNSHSAAMNNLTDLSAYQPFGITVGSYQHGGGNSMNCYLGSDMLNLGLQHTNNYHAL